MANANTQIIKARDERETGNADKALAMFLRITRKSLDLNQLHYYLGELGLTYWHLKQYDTAAQTFTKLLTSADSSGDLSYKAWALRNLSRPEFNTNTPDNALKYALRARELAVEAKREDIAWFDHGVITVLMFTNGDKDEIRKWFTIEAQDLCEISRNTKDKLAKWVWVSGMLMDRGQIFNDIADLYLALIICEEFNLVRRKEQIEKLITKFNK